jgi:hypothetical protein
MALCDRDHCSEGATTRIQRSDRDNLYLCDEHKSKLADKIRDKVVEKFDDLSEEEIKDRMLDGGADLL